MAETASTIPTWRVGGQIDQAAVTELGVQFADITVTATLTGSTGENVVDPTNSAHVLRGPYVNVVGGVAGTATTAPAADGSNTIAGRQWWTHPLKATTAADPNDALQPSGLAWSIVVTAIDRRNVTHTLDTFTVAIDADRDYAAELETITVPGGTAGADVAAIAVGQLVEPPAVVADNTFEARVLDAAYPIGGTTGQALTKASATNYDVAWATIEGGGGATSDDTLYASDYGVDPAKYALWNGTNGHTSMTDGDSTADIQAAFDAAAAVHANGLGGVTLRFPKGRFLMIGTVTIPDMPGAGGFHVDMTDTEIVFKPQTSGALAADPPALVMFQTGAPTSNTNAEVLNGVRDMWTWRGGFFDGDRVAGEIAFRLDAVSRMVMERVKIQSFHTGIYGRFVLHFKLRDSRLTNCSHYGVRIEASYDDWTNATPANAASNGALFENVRFYGDINSVAQLKVAHSGHVVRDCTFEGGGPSQYNYIFENLNTSVLTSKIENLWIENEPGIAHFKIDTMHQFEFDIQYSASSAPIADIWRSSLCMVRRVPWPAVTKYKVDSLSPTGSAVNLVFHGAGRGGKFNPATETVWTNKVYPAMVQVIGGFDDNGKPIIYMSGGGGGSASRGQIWSMKPPLNDTPGQDGTSATVWTLVHQPAAPVNTVAPVASGTATVGSTLSVTTGTWTGRPTPTFTYQWNRGGVAISGATASTYLLASADIGATITATVTGTNVTNPTNGVQTVSATSNGIGPIA